MVATTAELMQSAGATRQHDTGGPHATTTLFTPRTSQRGCLSRAVCRARRHQCVGGERRDHGRSDQRRVRNRGRRSERLAYRRRHPRVDPRRGADRSAAVSGYEIVRKSDVTSLPLGGTSDVAVCPAGKKAVGGGFVGQPNLQTLASFRFQGGVGWDVSVLNSTNSSS